MGIKLTPLYDVMSAFPAIGKGPLQYERLKLAMRITSGRYHLESIARRHFIEMAKAVKFPVLEMDQIIDGIIENRLKN